MGEFLIGKNNHLFLLNPPKKATPPAFTLLG